MLELIKNIGAARFGVMAGVAAALTAFFLYVAGVVSEPAMTILYAGLEPRDAAAVTAKLDSMNVKYEAKGDGGTILVPADQVTKLRMELASENLPSAGVGYEIFDKADSFGTTSFVQNINQLRALEGELARSIQTIDNIDAARVHLVIPERQIFSRDSQTPSGSVVLKTRTTLSRGQVAAIQHLVAAAVAGLEPSRVAVVDERGNLLAGGDEKTGADAAASDQEEQTTDFEDRLRQRIESIVASVVGPGPCARRSRRRHEPRSTSSETSESYDPDSKVIRSTQTVEQNANDINAGGNNAASRLQRPAEQPAERLHRQRQQIREYPDRRNDQLRDLQNRAYQHARRRRRQARVRGRRRRRHHHHGHRGQGNLQGTLARGNEADRIAGKISHRLQRDARRPGAGRQHGVRPRRRRLPPRRRRRRFWGSMLRIGSRSSKRPFFRSQPFSSVFSWSVHWSTACSRRSRWGARSAHPP